MLVIGCGNRDRSDDGAGVMVAERVRELGLRAETCTGESLALIEAWSRADDVILVDAVVTGAPVGKVWIWDVDQLTPQGIIFPSTHGYGVAEAIKLARILERLPKRLRVFGIEGRLFDFGSEISAEVMCAVEEVVKQITAKAAAIPLGSEVYAIAAEIRLSTTPVNVIGGATVRGQGRFRASCKIRDGVREL